MRRRITRPATRVTLALLLGLALVVGSATTASALWSASAPGTSAIIIGKVVGSISGTDSMTTTFSSTVTSLTAPLTFQNVGNITGTYSTSVKATQGPSLASNVRVVAWPVAQAADCTASATVGSTTVTGTWASLPSMSGTLAPSASAVWCTRSTPTTSAPPSSTTNPIVSLTVSAGSWTSAVTMGGFYLNTSAAPTTAPATTCTPYDGNFHVTIGFDPSARSQDTSYGLLVAGTRINASEQGYHPSFDLSGSDVSTTVAPDGVTRVDVAVLDASGNPTGDIAATGTVTFTASNGSRTVVCGG